MSSGTAVVADFIGGPNSGKILPLWRDEFVVEFSLSPEFGARFWTDTEAEPSSRPRFRKAVYRRCGVRDDGRRVYAYDARSSDA